MFRVAGAIQDVQLDAIAREEPLEIQLDGAPLAVVMRTPGHDADLALGFLVTERVIARSRRCAVGAPLPRGRAARGQPTT
jgi:FdhD protein